MSLQTCSSHRVQRETWSVLAASVVQAVWRLEGRPTGQLVCRMAVWSCCQLGAHLVLRASDFVPSQRGLPHKLTCNTVVASQEWAFQVIGWLPVLPFWTRNWSASLLPYSIGQAGAEPDPCLGDLDPLLNRKHANGI